MGVSGSDTVEYEFLDGLTVECRWLYRLSGDIPYLQAAVLEEINKRYESMVDSIAGEDQYEPSGIEGGCASK